MVRWRGSRHIAHRLIRSGSTVYKPRMKIWSSLYQRLSSQCEIPQRQNLDEDDSCWSIILAMELLDLSDLSGFSEPGPTIPRNMCISLVSIGMRGRQKLIKLGSFSKNWKFSRIHRNTWSFPRQLFPQNISGRGLDHPSFSRRRQATDYLFPIENVDAESILSTPKVPKSSFAFFASLSAFMKNIVTTCITKDRREEKKIAFVSWKCKKERSRRIVVACETACEKSTKGEDLLKTFGVGIFWAPWFK